MAFPAGDRKSNLLKGVLVWAAIAAVMLLIYFPCLNSDFLWNDGDYVTSAKLHSLHGLWCIWFQVGATQQYYPLLHSAFWVEQRLWGNATIGYHLVNIALHAASACLLALILKRLWTQAAEAAWLAALIFAVHPVFVESVAWITEQKNTLSGVFFFAAALTYLHFDEKRKPRLYVGALILFVCAVLCKTTTAPLPAALLVVFWWRRGRLSWRRDVQPLLPWFVLGAAGGLFSSWVERRFVGADGTDFTLTFGQGILVAGRALWFYLGKLLWPVDQIFIYPRWHVDTAVWWQYLYPLGAIVALAILWRWSRVKRGPLAGALLFAGLLFPVLGFFNLYVYIYSYVTDHFLYLPSIGIIALAAAGWGRWRKAESLGPLRGRRTSQFAAILALVILSVLSWRLSHRYVNDETLYRSIIARNPDSWMPHNNLGNLLCDEGRLDEAMAEYKIVLKLRPGAHIIYNLGIILMDEGRTDEAIAQYHEALRLDPKYREAWYNLGIAEASVGRLPEAVAAFRESVRILPKFVEGHSSLGLALAEMGSLPEAIAECQEAIRLSPGFPEAHFNLGFAFADAGQIPESIEQYEETIRLQPDFPEAHGNLGFVLATAGRREEAIAEYREALRLKPGLADIRRKLDLLLQTQPSP